MEYTRFRFISLRRVLAAIAIGLVLAFLFPLCAFFSDCGEIRQSVVRLHILANSDSRADQSVKLLVRDAVLKTGEKIFSGEATPTNAESLFKKSRGEIEKTADRILRENGFPYSCRAVFCEEYFDTRAYSGFTLPAGKYKAVKLILGSGTGHNWWCVMFPPLCLPAAGGEAALSDCFGGRAGIVENYPKYKIRFKTVEIIEKVKSKWRKGE